MESSIGRWLVAAAIAALVAGCGNSGAKTASQVAVKVNKDEISVYQVNQMLSRVPAQNMTPDQQQQARAQIVQGLVDQQLFIQRAIDKKLDRDPEVLGAIEASRRQILAQAYLQKTLAAQAKPADEDIKKFYADNPALFAERKVYRLRELTTNVPDDVFAAFQEQVGKVKSLEELAAWLRSKELPFNGNAAVRGAEQLPLEYLPRVSAMKDGELGVFRAPGATATTVVQVVQAQRVPLSATEATPFIEQFLSNRKRDELAQADLKRLRGEAKLEFVGDFAQFANGADAAKKAAPAAAATKAPEPSATAVIEKGLSSLK